MTALHSSTLLRTKATALVVSVLAVGILAETASAEATDLAGSASSKLAAASTPSDAGAGAGIAASDGGGGSNDASASSGEPRTDSTSGSTSEQFPSNQATASESTERSVTTVGPQADEMADQGIDTVTSAVDHASTEVSATRVAVDQTVDRASKTVKAHAEPVIATARRTVRRGTKTVRRHTRATIDIARGKVSAVPTDSPAGPATERSRKTQQLGSVGEWEGAAASDPGALRPVSPVLGHALAAERPFIPAGSPSPSGPGTPARSLLGQATARWLPPEVEPSPRGLATEASLAPPDTPEPSSGAGTGALASAGTVSGATAVLLTTLWLMAPDLGRRLRLSPAQVRPISFLSLLERPG